MVEQVNAMSRSCREMRCDESNIDEYQALKKTRAKLVKTLLSTFRNPLLKSGAKLLIWIFLLHFSFTKL